MPQGSNAIIVNFHRYWTEDPTLVFVGLPWKVAPFLLMDCQTRHAAAALCGRLKAADASGKPGELPTRKKMEQSRLDDEQFRSVDV
jgi:hypothetical protein